MPRLNDELPGLGDLVGQVVVLRQLNERLPHGDPLPGDGDRKLAARIDITKHHTRNGGAAMEAGIEGFDNGWCRLFDVRDLAETKRNETKRNETKRNDATEQTTTRTWRR